MEADFEPLDFDDLDEQAITDRSYTPADQEEWDRMKIIDALDNEFIDMD